MIAGAAMDRDTSEFAAPAPLGLALPQLRIGRPTRAALQGTAACLGIVALSGLVAWLVFGPVASHGGVDPPGYVDHLGGLRDALTAPFARWDSVWYVLISRYGYAPGPSGAFFPAYPGLVHIVALLGVGYVAAGVAVSVGSLAIALRLLWRLTALELGEGAARFAVLATALFPMAFFFTAVYSESLFLAVSIGAFWMARNGRWAWAGMLGAAAAATRSAGMVILVGLAVIYLQQPARRRRDLLWLGLVPLGLGAYVAWLALLGLDPASPFHAQENWFRHFAGPFGGVLDGVRAAIGGARQLLSGQSRHVYFGLAGGDPIADGWHNVTLFAFLLAAIPALIGVVRRLPRAYGAYAIAALALPLSYPVTPQPLMSLPRFLAVLFPLQMWTGAWLADHPRAPWPLLATSGGLLALSSGMFATWHWVA
jgi:hypothetical protein